MALPHSSVHDELRGLAFVSLSLVTFTLGVVVVSLRMYLRISRRITGWDDYTICIACVMIPSRRQLPSHCTYPA